MARIALLAIALALTTPEIAAAAEPETLQPTSQELTRGLYGFTPEETRRIAVFPEMKRKPVNSARMKDVDFADGKGAEHLLRIGADGQMKACFIIGSISTPQEQKESCESITLMEEFTPALDFNGSPIEAPYYLSYRTLVRTVTIPRAH